MEKCASTNKIYIKLTIIFLCLFIIIYLLFKKKITINDLYKISNNKNRVGITCLQNSQNVGNILVKFAMLKKLEEMGFNATILTPKALPGTKSYFINRNINSNLFIIKNNYSEELTEKDFNYLLVNSDQTWAYNKWKYFYDVGFLMFAKNWNVKKFIYGASIGSDKWKYNKTEDEKIKKLLTKFNNISFREKGTIKLVEHYLGIKGELVLDPTLIIDKEYYLNEIKDYKRGFNSKEKFIFVYQLDNNEIIKKFIKDSKKKLKYKIKKFNFNKKDNDENFIFIISNCKAVITDSYHGTIFSIIFNKPFISFINSSLRGKGRFDSLKEIFHLNNRIIYPSKNLKININLLIKKPNINQTLLAQLRKFSIDYLKKNLDLL